MSLTALNPDNLPSQSVEQWKFTNITRALPAGLVEDISAQDIVITTAQGTRQEIDLTGEAGKHHKPHLKINLERGETLTLIENHTGQGAYWKNMVSEITLADGATLHHIRIQDDSHEAINTNMVHITLGRDANYEGFTLNLGAKLTRHEIKAELQDENSNCTFNGINLLGDDQHGDTTILIEHQAPHCTSNQLYRSILDDKSRVVFQGKVHVHQIAQKTDAYQLSNALLLSEKAEMDVKPELEIYADDVKCSHGSTIGQLDEEPLFYLRTRGLNETQARLLLIEAFIAEVTEKVRDESMAQSISKRTTQWLLSAL